MNSDEPLPRTADRSTASSRGKPLWARIAAPVVAVLMLGGLASCSSSNKSTSKKTTTTTAAAKRALDAPGDGVTLHVDVTSGPTAGPVLVLIHGGPGLSHHYLEPLKSLATDRLRVVTYDQRGVGASTKPSPPSYTVDNYVNDLEAVRVALGVKQLHLLGHSWGAMVAQAYTAAHADRVASLVLVDGEPPDLDSTAKGQARFDQRQRELVKEGIVPAEIPLPVGNDCRPYMEAILPVYFADPKSPVPKSFQTTDCELDVLTATQAALAPASFAFKSALATFAGPSLVIFGERDPFGTEWAKELADALPASRPEVVIIAKAGHFPWLDSGELEQRVSTFLERLL